MSIHKSKRLNHKILSPKTQNTTIKILTPRESSLYRKIIHMANTENKVIKLNLGCGTDHREGYINVDSSEVVKPDKICNLQQLPWPFPDNYADEILMRDSLEHLPDAHSNILEVHRILKPGGIFHCSVPYAKCDGAFQAPEHKSFFTEKSFDYFCGISGYEAFGPPKFEMVSVRLTTYGATLKTRLRNLIPFRMFLRHFLWNMYDGVEVIMKAKK